MCTLQQFPLCSQIPGVRDTLLELLVQFVVDGSRLVNWRVTWSSNQFQVLLWRITPPFRWPHTRPHKLLLLRHLLKTHVIIVALHDVQLTMLGRVIGWSLCWRDNRVVRHHMHAVQRMTFLTNHVVVHPVGIVLRVLLLSCLVLRSLALFAALPLRYSLQFDPLHFASFDLPHWLAFFEVDVLGLYVDDALVLAVIGMWRNLVALRLSLKLHLLVFFQCVHSAFVK